MMNNFNDSHFVVTQDGGYNKWEDSPVPPLFTKPVDPECEGLKKIRRTAQRRILVEKSLAINLSRFPNKRQAIGEYTIMYYPHF